MTKEYEIIKSFQVGERGNTEICIAGNGEDFFITFFDTRDYRYSRPAGAGLTVQAQDLNYVAIGAPRYNTLGRATIQAKKWLLANYPQLKITEVEH